jgi:hypothetical protein
VWKRVVLTLAISGLICAGAAAQPANNNCAAALPLSEGSTPFNTAGATNDGPAASCGQIGADIWYTYTATCDSTVVMSMCGTGASSNYDAMLVVYNGASCVGAEIACNDDFCGSGLGSQVSFPATNGQQFKVRVAGWSGAQGSGVLNVICQPPFPGDNCPNAVAITEGSYTGTTAGASNDGSADCGSSASSADVWYRYTATQDCELWIDTCGSSFDTVLSAHTGCPGTPANQLACNDDTCGVGSRVIVNVTSGTTYWIRIAGWQGATGSYALHVLCQQPSAPGADAYIGEINQFQQFGRLGDVVGCALDSPLCNAGTQPLDWYGNPDPRHPFAAFNMYRLMSDRFEQIGQSWCKHGFGAGQSDACGFGCIPYPNSTHLGVGCSDTYDAGTNANQQFLGPRYEINPWTGSYTYPGSYLQLHANDPHNPVEHRLQLHDADLAAAQNPGAVYVGEVYIVCHDDVNHMNSSGREPVTVTGVPGGVWNFNVGAPATVNGPAIQSWPGATLTTIPPNLIDDGRSILAVKVTDIGNGTWHYEYALYNHDMDRAVRSLRIPVASTTVVTNIGFHAVESGGEGYNNAPWTSAIAGGALTWSTDPYEVNPAANPLRWGTLYNFRFDANVGPAQSIGTLGLYKPGTPATLTGVTQGPSGAVGLGDMNQDAHVDLRDVAAFDNCFTGSGGAPATNDCEPAHFDGDTDIDLTDYAGLEAVLTGP